MDSEKDKSSSRAIKTPIALRMNLKAQLRYFLDLREMSAAQLARKASVPKQSISGWLAGSNPRDVRQIKRVADVLGTSVDNLLFGSGSERREKVTDLDALLGDSDGWIGGLVEIRLRRVKSPKGRE